VAVPSSFATDERKDDICSVSLRTMVGICALLLVCQAGVRHIGPCGFCPWMS
jgi:hypothetical protein